jgi:hypothetical protein
MGRDSERIQRLEERLSSLDSQVKDLQQSIKELRSIAFSKGNTSPTPAEQEEVEKLLDEIDKINQQLKGDENEKTLPAPLGSFVFSSVAIFLISAVVIAILIAINMLENKENPYQYALLIGVVVGAMVVIAELFAMKNTAEYGTNFKLFISMVSALIVSVACVSYMFYELLKGYAEHIENMALWFFWIPLGVAVILLFIAFRNRIRLRELGRYTSPGDEQAST